MPANRARPSMAPAAKRSSPSKAVVVVDASCGVSQGASFHMHSSQKQEDTGLFYGFKPGASGEVRRTSGLPRGLAARS